MLTPWLRQLERLRADRPRFVAVVLLLMATGYLAGSIVRGGAASGRLAPAQAAAVPRSAVLQTPVFAGIIQPIWQRRCLNCHGPAKHKAGLRLDNLEGLRRGGQDGPVIQPGHARDSLLLQRLRLPLDAAHHMPPEGQPQPSAEEIDLIEWWINSGAPVAATAGDLKPGPEIRSLLQVLLKETSSGK
jgi:hypothetical protein